MWSTVCSAHQLVTACLRGSSRPTRLVQPPTAAVSSPVAICISRVAIARPEAEITTWPSFALYGGRPPSPRPRWLTATPRCESADRRVQRGVAVNQRGRGAERGADRCAGQRHQPAHRLAQRIKGRPVAIGAVLPEPGDRNQDDVALQLAQPVIAEAHFLHDPGPEVLQHHIGSRHQGGKDLLAALGPHVEAHALLAAVVDREIDALAAHHRLGFARLLAAQLFDLDDLGAEIREDHAAARPGLVPGQFQYPHAIEGSGHPLLLPYRLPPDRVSGGETPEPQWVFLGSSDVL